MSGEELNHPSRRFARRRAWRPWHRAARGLALVASTTCLFTAAAPAGAEPTPTGSASPAAADGASPTAGHEVPVAATFAYDARQDASDGPIRGAINAVVRIPGGTAVFYSIGGPGDVPGAAMPSIGLNTPYNVSDAWAVGIVDPQGMHYYLPLVGSDGHCLCSRSYDIADYGGPKTPLVGYAVLPPLPARLTAVTVDFGFGNVLQDVPVTDELPGPTASSTPVELGSGWPALPSRAAIDATDKGLSIRPLATNTASPEAATKTSPHQTSIALSSNVLFAFNKATLTAKANSTLDDAAAKISRSATGTVTVVGYTDSTGSDAYNQTLSEKRAHVVQAALRKRVTDSRVSFRATGRGERDPVADNSTAAGRALNRRVTVTFTTGGR
jgi:outer membrane protein OmpA-like peptidoglycan-associated protein